MIGGLIWAAMVLVLGAPFVLLWWWLADSWADEEHKRFKPAQHEKSKPMTVNRHDVEKGVDAKDPRYTTD